jgi:hypothetical protein
VRCDWEIHRHLCGVAQKNRQSVLYPPVSIFRTHLSENLPQPSLTVMIS